jgi:ComF family protein
MDICEKCTSNPPAYRMMRSWAVFDSPIQNGLHTMKYRGNRAFGEALAVQIADFFHSLGWQVDMIIPVPLGRKRMQERGYNQVALVAEPLAYAVDVAYSSKALWKARETRSQVGLNVSERQKNVDQAYQADEKIVKQKSVVLMDDVATTGSTILACTDALMSAGAREVYALTIARALSHHDLNRV